MSVVTVLLAVSRVRVETILGFKIQISGITHYTGCWCHFLDFLHDEQG